MKKLLIITALVLFAGIAFGQTLDKGKVIGFAHISVELNEGITMDQFMDFIKKEYMPEYEKNYKGVQVVIMKADRGEHVNQLGWMSVFESLEARNNFWPEEGEPSEAGKAAGEKMQPMNDKMQSFGTVTPGFSDWIIH